MLDKYKIAICGQANSGKNTLSKMLVKSIREKTSDPYAVATYMAFADPIKEMAEIMFPNVPSKYFFGSSKYRSEIVPNILKDNKPVTVRQVLIDIGTNLGRNYNNSLWLNNFDTRYNKSQAYSKIMIVSDLRFINEFAFLKEKNFKIIKLKRPNIDKIDDISETQQESLKDSDFDFIINNDKSLGDLKLAVKNVISNII